MGSRSRRWLNQSTYSRVAYSRWSRSFQGARLWMSSVLYRPMTDSARALSYESPTEPTDGVDAGFGEPVRVANGQILGGFKRSSQRLESEELQWEQGRFVGLIVRCGRRCGRLVVRRSGGVSIGSGFWKGSLVGCRARMPVWRLVCRRRLVRVGSATMAGWSHFLLSLFGGAICLLLSEKEIAVLHARDCGVGEIARRLGRCASTISRELGRNAATRSGGLEYRATTAQWHSDRRACRPKVAKLAANDELRDYVADRLGGQIARPDGELVPGPQVRWVGRRHGPRKDRRWATSWSPEQISRRLRVDFPHNESMRISHEAIYQAAYVQGRGALRRELVACLANRASIASPTSTNPEATPHVRYSRDHDQPTPRRGRRPGSARTLGR